MSVSFSEAVVLGKSISSCSSRKDWERSIDFALKVVGAKHYLITLDTFGSTRDLPEYVLSTYPEEWMSHYSRSMLIREDPLRRYSQGHCLPIVWSTFRHDDSSEFWKRRWHFGLREGITVPIKGLGMSGSISIAVEKRDCHDEYVAILNVLTPHIAEKILTHDQVVAPSEGGALSPRELEVLRWLAEGKRSSEIAIILGCAERTINFHATNIVRKMDASCRQHAVAKAVYAGLISPAL